MTYEKAAQALVAAGILDKTQVASAIAVLNSPAVDMTYPDWAETLAKAGLIDKSQVKTAADVMYKAGEVESEKDPNAFKKGLENADIL